MLLLLPSVTLTLLVIVSVSAHNAPGVPPHQNIQEGQGQDLGGNKLKFQSEIHNADHIMEHLQNVIKTKPKDQMTEEELEFHYFKMHDYDNNNKLDGVEIGKALTHFHEDHQEDTGAAPPGQEQPTRPPPKIFTDDEIANIVDVVIGDNDEDGDGYVEYFEFKRKQEQQRQNPPDQK